LNGVPAQGTEVDQVGAERASSYVGRSRTRGARAAPPTAGWGHGPRFAVPLFLIALLASCSIATSPVWPGSVGIATVVLVVGDADAPSVSDGRLRDHLRAGLAADVAVVSERDRPPLAAVDLVVIAPSSSSGALGERYADAPVPVLVLNDGLWDDLHLASGSADAGAQTSVVVLDAEPPAAGGLAAGPHRVLATGSVLRHVVGLAPDGLPIAAAGDDAAQVVLFAVEAGARLTQGVAPARRVGLGAREDAYDRWLAPAWDLFDGSVAWLLGHEAERRDRTALVVSGGGVDALNASELALRSRLRAQGFEVAVRSDRDLRAGDGDAFDVVVMSKTVDSVEVGQKLKDTATGVVFWEDNQQQRSMLATIDDDGRSGTAWHSAETQADVAGDAPDGLTGGYRGRVRFYTQADEMTWAPAGSLPDDAIRIARTPGGDRTVVYAYDRGDRLADGSRAAGRRAFFGLYDDSFRYLTLDAVALFDAVLEWTARAPR
jgi:hypothetical protein